LRDPAVLATFVYFVLPVILLCIGLPIYLILLIASLVAVVFVADVPLTTIQTNMFGGLDNFPWARAASPSASSSG
jgi:C4-dicarboxylate transporter DctM subunit